MSWVGASSGRCTYSIPPISFKKYGRSSFLENPANCELLFSRTSTTRFTPASFSAVKNSRADFCVKPMVNSLISILPWLFSQCQSILFIGDFLSFQAIGLGNYFVGRAEQLAFRKIEHLRKATFRLALAFQSAITVNVQNVDSSLL